MYKTIKYEVKDQIAYITLSRPEALNALNTELIHEVDDALTQIEKDEDIRALILTGEGRSFAAGADIAEMYPLGMEGGRKVAQNGSGMMRHLEKMPIPVIAAVNGFALGGGCELSMACDIILASEKAKFGQPEVGLGITPGFSGSQRLPRRVGVGKAKEMIYSGKIITAQEAKEIGLVDELYSPEELMDKAVEMAKSFMVNAPIAIKYSKAAIDRGMQMDIDNGIALENEFFAMCFATEDKMEGMRAFLEKGEKHFKNK